MNNYLKKIEILGKIIEKEKGESKKSQLKEEKMLAKLCEKNEKVRKAIPIIKELLLPLVTALKKEDKNIELNVHVSKPTFEDSFTSFVIVWWDFQYRDTIFKVGVQKKCKLFDIEKFTDRRPDHYYGDGDTSKLSLESLKKCLKKNFLDYIIQGKA